MPDEALERRLCQVIRRLDWLAVVRQTNGWVGTDNDDYDELCREECALLHRMESESLSVPAIHVSQATAVPFDLSMP